MAWATLSAVKSSLALSYPLARLLGTLFVVLLVCAISDTRDRRCSHSLGDLFCNPDPYSVFSLLYLRLRGIRFAKGLPSSISRKGRSMSMQRWGRSSQVALRRGALHGRAVKAPSSIIDDLAYYPSAI